MRREGRPSRVPPFLILLLLGGSLAAFGGVYAWALGPLIAGCFLLGLLVRPSFGGRTRALDLALGAVLLACALPLVPLPPAVVRNVSPARARLQEAVSLGAPPSWLTLSIDPAATAAALLLFAAVVVMYGAARRVFELGGVRLACRGVGWMGLALACVALAQRGASSGRIYGFWTPFDRGALPYGPFVNRNHCATWLVMSIPVCFGYLLARLARGRGSEPVGGADPRTSRLASLRWTFDGRSVWLTIAGTSMVLALAWSLSRSGIAAFALSSVAALGATRARMDVLRRIWIAALVVLAVAAIATLADVGAVLDRFVGSVEAGRLGRLAIWRDTLPMIRDFALTGSGIGTYQTAMLVYQTGDRTYYYNQAHNDVLQVAAEGGLLVTVPAMIAVGAFAALAKRRLTGDRSGMFWIRAGAAAGLAGVALQGLWETGLRVPANALLAAVLAALLTHSPRATAPAAAHRPPSSRDPREC